MLENINTVAENSTPTPCRKRSGFQGHFPQQESNPFKYVAYLHARKLTRHVAQWLRHHRDFYLILHTIIKELSHM